MRRENGFWVVRIEGDILLTRHLNHALIALFANKKNAS